MCKTAKNIEHGHCSRGAHQDNLVGQADEHNRDEQ